MDSKPIHVLFNEVHQELKRRLKTYGRGAIIKYQRSGRNCIGTVIEYRMGDHPRVIVRAGRTGKEYPILWFHILDVQPAKPAVCGTEEEQFDIFKSGVMHG